MGRNMEMRPGAKANKEPDHCHPGCNKENPCNGQVCPFKKSKKRRSRRKGSNSTASNNNEITSRSCPRSCTEVNPCFGEVCQYKKQQPDVGIFDKHFFLDKNFFVGFLLGLIFAKWSDTF